MVAIADLVHQNSASTGTGNLTLSAVNGKVTFDTAFGHGATTNVFYYFISNRNAAEEEWGTGHMSDATTLVRDTVIGGSNGTSPVNFSAGTLDVVNDLPAERQLDSSNNLSDVASASTARANLGLAIGTDVEAHDADLTTFAGLSPSNDDFLQRKSGAWANRTVAQVKTDLSLSGTNTGDQAVMSAGDFRAATSSKLLDAALTWGDAAFKALTDATTISIDMSLMAALASVALAGNRTLGNPTNTKVGQFFCWKFTATTSTRTLALGTNYSAEANVESFPISITTSATVYVCGFVEDSTHIRIYAVLRF